MALGETDTFVFYLARDLGKTVAELDDMSWAEYVRWRAFYVWDNTMQQHEIDKAKNRG